MPVKLILASELTAALPKIAEELDPVRKGARLLFVPTAAIGEGWVPEDESHVDPFRAMGFEVDRFDLVGRKPQEARKALSRSSAVYVCGGNTFFLVDHMRRSGFFGLVKDRIAEGLVYIGSSAGSVAACPDIGFAETLDDRSKAELSSDEGLGLVDFDILPHLDHPEYGGHVRRLYESPSPSGRMRLGLCDGQVAVVEDRGFRVV